MDHKREQLNGWCEVSLKRAVFPRREKVLPQNCPDSPYLGMDNVEGGTGRVIETRRSGDMRSAAARFYTGDVLYGRLRPYLNKVVCASFDGLASAEFIILPGNSAVDSQFLSERLRAADFVSFAAHLNEGDRPRVNFDQIGDFELRLPPISEQRRIVAKIEELFSELDKGVESLKAARAQLKTYRQSLLKAAFEGRLTEQWRRDNADKLETADQLLQRIREERESRYQQQLGAWKVTISEWDADKTTRRKPQKPSGSKKLSPLTSEELTYLPDLPDLWEWTRIGTCAERVTVGHVGSMKNEYVDDGIPFLRSLNVRPNRFDRKGMKFVSRTFHEALAKSSLEPGDVVVVRSGSIGISCVIPEDIREANCSDLVIIKKPNGLRSRLLAYYMNWQSEGRVKGHAVGVALTHFNTKSVESFPVPLIPIDEQRRLEETLEASFTEVAQLEQCVESAIQQTGSLRQSILKHAFEGKLVPQDPDDEPASVLLERIRTEQEEAPKPRGRRRKAGA